MGEGDFFFVGLFGFCCFFSFSINNIDFWGVGGKEVGRKLILLLFFFVFFLVFFFFGVFFCFFFFFCVFCVFFVFFFLVFFCGG